jgi:sporulation protein YqfC
MPPKKGALEQAANLFDLPPDIVAGLPRVEITGCSQVYIENHQGLLGYEPNEITVNGGDVVLRIRGEDLRVRAMRLGQLRLEGTLSSIEMVY